MKGLKEFLNEGKTTEKGCAMLYFDFPNIKDIHDKIEESDIYDEEGFGLEKESHCTLLYGFDPKIDGESVINKLKECVFPKELKLKNVSLFENEFDVLKFDVEAGELSKLNKMLTDNFDYETDYPDYHPHCTIAYINKGEGKKYVDMFEGKEFTVIPKQIVYSDAKRNKIYKNL